ncbi:MAG: Uma2 family endonuclease [Chitinophagaceae bacterium]
MPAVLEKKKTVQDYLQLPEGAPYQLLNGELVMSPSPGREHQKVGGAIYRLISNLCVERKIGEVYYAPFDVYLDEENVVQPDICFFSNERLSELSDRGAEAAPDIVIELLSPSNAYYDLRYKLDLYEKHGVKEYFIVDPEDNIVIAYANQNNKFTEQYREKNIIRSTVLGTDITW